MQRTWSKRWKLLVATAVSLILLAGGVSLYFTSVASKRSGSAQTRSFSAGSLPNVRWWWGEVPEEVRLAALKTDDVSNIRPDDYVGPESCAECHESNYKNWLEHRHRWMNAPATEETVVGDFGGNASIEYYGGRATFYREGDSYRMNLVRGEVQRTYRITQTLGSRFYQYYVGVQLTGPEPKPHEFYERDHVLPFGYWIDEREWVPVVHVGGGLREGEPSVADHNRPDPFVDPQMIGYSERCSQCHTTQPLGDWLVSRTKRIRHSPRGFDFDMVGYLGNVHPELLDQAESTEDASNAQIEALIRTLDKAKARVWGLTSGITCEACHNGCRSHVGDAEEVMPKFFPASPNVYTSARGPQDVEETLGLSPANQNWICSRCHAGVRFEFAAGMGTWNSVEFENASKGACYEPVEGKEHLTCVHCHEPHTTIGRSWSRSADQDDASCLRCHEKYEDAESRQAHTHHAPTSTGSRCMNCHMPRIDEGLQDMVRTHMIFSPTNADMIESNQPNACNMCHVDKPIDWTLGFLREWYGRTYKEQRMAENYDARERSGPATLGWLESWHPSTQMVAADVLTRGDAQWALPQLLRTLDSHYMLNRQFAMKGLQRMLGVRFIDFGYRFTMFADERRQPLERIWAELVGDGGAFPFVKDPAEDAEAAIGHYRRVLAYDSDSYMGHYHLGSALLKRGESNEAIGHFRRSLQIKPDSYTTHYQLAVAFRARGEPNEAIMHLRQTLQIKPDFAEGHYLLGLTLQSTGDVNAAARQFREGLRRAPDHAGLHNIYGAVLAKRGALDEAIGHFEQALRIKPDFEKASLNLSTVRRLKRNADRGVAPRFDIRSGSKRSGAEGKE